MDSGVMMMRSFTPRPRKAYLSSATRTVLVSSSPSPWEKWRLQELVKSLLLSHKQSSSLGTKCWPPWSTHYASGAVGVWTVNTLSQRVKVLESVVMSKAWYFTPLLPLAKEAPP
jgi:hypothetical protein